MNYKFTIIDALETLRKNEQAANEIWKVRAYSKAIKSIKEFDGDITSVDDVKGLDGIGAKILAKIKEIIDTGKLAAAEKIKNEDTGRNALVETLMQVYGIGPAKAKDLVDNVGIKSLEELKIRGDEVLNDKQLIGLKYHADFLERIPRSEMIKHDSYIQEVINKVNPNLQAVITGSYRRGATDSGDIDVLISWKNVGTGGTNKIKLNFKKDIISEIVDIMTQNGYMKDVLAIGEKKCLGVCKLKRHRMNRRIDLLWTPSVEFPFALLYFTGSQEFNILMRNHALTKGYSLSEHGLKEVANDNTMVNCNLHTEEDVFRFLELKYIAPEMRSKNLILETL